MNRIRIMCIISILCLVLLAGCPRMPWQSAQQYGTTGEGTGNTGTPNLNLTLPAGQTAANFTCAQAYMNNTPPNGQTVTIPFLNVTNNATGTYYNLTLYLNQSLTTGFSIWTQPSYHRNPSSINVSTTPQIIIKRLNVGESVGLWMWGECYNVSDNQSMSFEFAFSGGT